MSDNNLESQQHLNHNEFDKNFNSEKVFTNIESSSIKKDNNNYIE